MGALTEDFGFLRGLIIGVAGFVVMVLASMGQGALFRLGHDPATALTVVMYLGAGAMIAGPAWYWLGKPLVGWIRA